MDIFYILWLLFSSIQLFYWGVFFQRLVWQNFNIKLDGAISPSLSIIICARNEAANLQKNLESVLIQEYPLFELIVVNDASDDDSQDILEAFQAKFDYLTVLNISHKDKPGKKAALKKGIQHAKYDWLLLTDADCWPSSKHWVQKMMQVAIKQDKSMVLGYGPSDDQKGFLSKLVHYEIMLTAIQYFSSALWKIPYMGVGRNILYNRSKYGKYLNFESHADLISGDDDLFVNEAVVADDVAICIDNESYMISEPPADWSAFIAQKRRHYSVSHRYQWKHKVFLASISLSHFIHYAGIFMIIGLNIWNFDILVIFMVRLLLVFFVFMVFAFRTGRSKALFFILIGDIILPFYYLFFASALRKKVKYTWN